MIGFNGTYLPAATHHGMRITDACLGGQWVMGGWLKTATQQAILAAFGAEEGKAVILRTNDYLNAIALTDPQRAQQLADFIQEDPLLVCSLVETSKVRLLMGDGKAWIRLGAAFTMRSEIEVGCLTYTEDRTAFVGLETNNSKGYAGVCEIRGKTMLQGVVSNAYIRYEPFTEYEQVHTLVCDAIDNNFYYDGKDVGTHNAESYIADGNILLFKSRTYPPLKGGIGHTKIYGVNGLVYDVAPFLHNGESGMLDIISGTFHPNANTEGSFTIALTPKTTLYHKVKHTT